MQGYLLGYLFVSFAVGLACLGVALGLAVRRRDPVSRAFLASYVAFSILVAASLVLALAEVAPTVISERARSSFQYLESIVGFYGIMLTLPLLVHRVFGVEDARRERILVAIVLATLGLQHVTEFALGSTPWDERGDWLENGVLIAIVSYSLWIACTRMASASSYQPLPARLLGLLALGVPATLFDLSYGEGRGLYLYPLWYGGASVLVTWTLVRAEPEPEPPMLVADGWGLSEREFEVAGQVAHGLSNKEIAATLHISTNTVKTHLRKIFEKAGVQSRFELIVRLKKPQNEPHPKG